MGPLNQTKIDSLKNVPDIITPESAEDTLWIQTQVQNITNIAKEHNLSSQEILDIENKIVEQITQNQGGGFAQLYYSMKDNLVGDSYLEKSKDPKLEAPQQRLKDLKYKSVTGNSLTLTSQGDAQVLLQNMSRVRTWVECQKVYTIGGLKDIITVREPSIDRVDKNFRKFLDLHTDKKPKNVTRKNEKND